MIGIRLEPGEAKNTLVIRGTGTGIPQEKVKQVFDPFWSEKPDGTRLGIGLDFCRRVIDSFGGHIECRSELGRFTEFRIVLPQIKPEASRIGSC
jgi:two-component system autoinducer 1 sensor kinase/phosphatase LuxN